MTRLHKGAIYMAVSWTMALVALATSFVTITEIFKSPEPASWTPKQSVAVNATQESKPWLRQQNRPEPSADMKPPLESSEKIVSRRDESLNLSKPVPMNTTTTRQTAPAANPNETTGVPFRGVETRHPPYVVPEKDSGVYPPGF
jgi:hypothetical protein